MNIARSPYTAFIISKNIKQDPDLLKILSDRGISASFKTPDEALEECRLKPPCLAIIEDDSSPPSGARIAAELLQISWTISAILVSKEDENELHERTEGLGILGAIKSFNDHGALNNLLDGFFRLSSCIPQ